MRLPRIVIDLRPSQGSILVSISCSHTALDMFRPSDFRNKAVMDRTVQAYAITIHLQALWCE